MVIFFLPPSDLSLLHAAVEFHSIETAQQRRQVLALTELHLRERRLCVLVVINILEERIFGSCYGLVASGGWEWRCCVSFCAAENQNAPPPTHERKQKDQHPPQHRVNKCHHSQQHQRQARNQHSTNNTDGHHHHHAREKTRARMTKKPTTQHNKARTRGKNVERTKRHTRHHTQRHDKQDITTTLMTDDAPPTTEKHRTRMT